MTTEQYIQLLATIYFWTAIIAICLGFLSNLKFIFTDEYDKERKEHKRQNVIKTGVPTPVSSSTLIFWLLFVLSCYLK